MDAETEYYKIFTDGHSFIAKKLSYRNVSIRSYLSNWPNWIKLAITKNNHPSDHQKRRSPRPSTVVLHVHDMTTSTASKTNLTAPNNLSRPWKMGRRDMLSWEIWRNGENNATRSTEMAHSLVKPNTHGTFHPELSTSLGKWRFFIIDRLGIAEGLLFCAIGLFYRNILYSHIYLRITPNVIDFHLDSRLIASYVELSN